MRPKRELVTTARVISSYESEFVKLLYCVGGNYCFHDDLTVNYDITSAYQIFTVIIILLVHICTCKATMFLGFCDSNDKLRLFPPTKTFFFVSLRSEEGTGVSKFPAVVVGIS